MSRITVIILLVLSGLCKAETISTKNLGDWALKTVDQYFKNEKLGGYDLCVKHGMIVRTDGKIYSGKKSWEIKGTHKHEYPIGLSSDFPPDVTNACAIILFGHEAMF